MKYLLKLFAVFAAAAICASCEDLTPELDSLHSDIDSLRMRMETDGEDSGITLSYIPVRSDYEDSVRIVRNGSALSSENLTLNYNVSPKEEAETIAKYWKATLTAHAVYALPKSGDASADPYIDLGITDVTAKNGILSVTVSTANLPRKEFVLGNVGAMAAVKFSNGGKETVSDYVRLAPASNELSLVRYMLRSFDSDGDGQVENLDRVTECGFYAVEFLDADEFNVNDLLVLLPALDTLCCGGQNLTSLDLSKNPNLTLLSCNNSSLTSLDLSKNPKLTYLYCRGNNLTSLDISNNLALTYVDICRNPNFTKLIYASLEQLVARVEVYADNPDTISLFFSDGTQIKFDETFNVEIDGKTWCYFNVGASFKNLLGTKFNFDDAQSACPEGWRLPTKDELESLSAHYSAYQSFNSYYGYFGAKPGRWLSGSNDYSSSVPAIYLMMGDYWSSSKSGGDHIYYIDISFRSVEMSERYSWSTNYVRCLKK